MARGRMISATISTSETVNAMSEWARLLFCFSIAHLDDFGFMAGSPAKLKAIVMPLSERPIADFAAAVAEWIASGSHTAYLAEDGRVYLRAVKFDDYQTGLHKRTRSRFPTEGAKLDAVGYLAAISGKFPESPASVPEVPLQQNRTEENRTEDEQKGKQAELRSDKPRGSAKDLVEGLALSDELRQLGSSLSLDSDSELEQFKDRMRGNGYRTNQGPVKDAAAAFRTHLRNAAKFARTHRGNGSQTTHPLSASTQGDQRAAINSFFANR